MLLGKCTLSTPNSVSLRSPLFTHLSSVEVPPLFHYFSVLSSLLFHPSGPHPEMLSTSGEGRRVRSQCGPGQLPFIQGTELPSAKPMVLTSPPPVHPLPGPVLWALPFVYEAPARPLKLPLMFQRNELVSHHESGFEMREKSPGEAILGNWGHSHLQSGGSEPRNAGKFIPRQEPRRD